MRGGIGENLESECQQRIPGKDSRRFIERLMHGRTSAPHVVVIHGRQVVMHQRIAMDAFNCRRRVQRRFIRHPA